MLAIVNFKASRKILSSWFWTLLKLVLGRVWLDHDEDASWDSVWKLAQFILVFIPCTWSNINFDEVSNLIQTHQSYPLGFEEETQELALLGATVTHTITHNQGLWHIWWIVINISQYRLKLMTFKYIAGGFKMIAFILLRFGNK